MTALFTSPRKMLVVIVKIKVSLTYLPFSERRIRLMWHGGMVVAKR